MKKRSFSLMLSGALAALSLPLAASPLPVPVDDALLGRVVEWRRDLHQHPELSNREFRTAEKVAAHLRSLGLSPQTGIAHTGVVAILKGGKPGPKIGIRADMDALPVTERNDLPFVSKATAEYRGQTVGVMHACGHDAHTAILMGVAEALVSIKDELPGEVMFIFQPAEEGPPEGEEGGAPLMLKEGLFAEFKPDAVFGLHVVANVPVGMIAVRPGPAMASADSFEIRVVGRQTHGSQPWGGIDPVVAASDIVTTAQTIISRRTNISKLPAVVTFGAINGGVRYNIIPDDLINVAEHVAAAHGAHVHTHKVPLEHGYPVTVNDPALTVRMRPSLEKAIGKDKVIEPPPGMGSEDFSYFANEVPGMFFFVGATPADQVGKAAVNHSPEFFMDEGALDVGLRSMLQVALDYLHQ